MLQQTPRLVMALPPSKVIFPPVVAEIVVILNAAVVVKAIAEEALVLLFVVSSFLQPTIMAIKIKIEGKLLQTVFILINIYLSK